MNDILSKGLWHDNLKLLGEPASQTNGMDPIGKMDVQTLESYSTPIAENVTNSLPLLKSIGTYTYLFIWFLDFSCWGVMW